MKLLRLLQTQPQQAVLVVQETDWCFNQLVGVSPGAWYLGSLRSV